MNVIVLVLVCLALLACGCSSSAVRCDGRLTPINSPAANSEGRSNIQPERKP